MRILVMGLPGAGKTTLAARLAEKLGYRHINADEVRKLYNDWDFSSNGRLTQSIRMNQISRDGDTISDFVCPTEETREAFDADFVIWMNTIERGRYQDTNEIFERPLIVDLELKSFNYDIVEIIKAIKCFETNKYSMITG